MIGIRVRIRNFSLLNGATGVIVEYSSITHLYTVHFDSPVYDLEYADFYSIELEAIEKGN